MRYIYDRIITKDDHIIEYLGHNLRRTGINKMGDIIFFTFRTEGMDPIIVCSSFAVQFKEAAEIFSKINRITTPSAAIIRLRTVFENPPEEMRFDAENGYEYKYIVNYKDIEIYMDLTEEKFTLEPQFRIKKRNTIGYNMLVNILDNPELAVYCETEK